LLLLNTFALVAKARHLIVLALNLLAPIGLFATVIPVAQVILV
jgi:hypothetical protein